MTWTEVPALPVVAPLAVVAFVLALVVLHRRGALTLLRAAGGAVACGYGAGILANTVFPVYLGDRVAVPQRWTVYLNLVPLANTEARDMVANVLVFVPLGLLLPILVRVRSVGRIVLVGFLLSLAMELVQLLNAVTGHGGHVADVNDLLANTVGAPLGYGLYRAAVMVPLASRVVAAAMWPPVARTAAGGRSPSRRRWAR